MLTRAPRSKRILFAWVALLLLACVSIGYAIVTTPSTNAETRIVTLEKEVRCPSCGNLAVYNSKSASSYSIADYIQHEVHSGASNKEIIDSLVASYGDTILMAPPANGVGLFLWLLPIVVALVLGWEVYRSLSARSRRDAHRARALALVPTSPGVADLGPPGAQAIEDVLVPDQGVPKDIAGSIRESSSEADGGSQPPEGQVSSPDAPGSRPRRRPLFSRRLAQIGAALVLVGVGAMGTLLLTRSGSSSAPTLTEELASGEALAGLGAVKQARVEFDHVLATYPSDPTALAYLGWIDFNLAKTKSAKVDAVSVLAHAATLGAYDASAQLYYGLALFYGEDRPSQAIVHLDRFLATRPSKSLVEQAYRLAKPVYLAAHRKIPSAF